MNLTCKMNPTCRLRNGPQKTEVARREREREGWHVCTFLSKNARASSPRELTFREGGCRNRKVVLGWSLGSKLRNGTPVLAQLCHQLFQFQLVVI